MHYRIGVGEHDWTLSLAAGTDGTLNIDNAGRSIELKLLDVDAQGATLVIDGIRQRHAWRLDGHDLWLSTRHGGLHLQDRTLAPVASKASASDGTLLAPMDGAIVEVLVSEGSPVRQGQLLMVLEAMKMEHPLKAGIDGVVRQLQVTRGDQVKNRQVLLRVETGH